MGFMNARKVRAIQATLERMTTEPGPILTPIESAFIEVGLERVKEWLEDTLDGTRPSELEYDYEMALLADVLRIAGVEVEE